MAAKVFGPDEREIARRRALCESARQTALEVLGHPDVDDEYRDEETTDIHEIRALINREALERLAI